MYLTTCSFHPLTGWRVIQCHPIMASLLAKLAVCASHTLWIVTDRPLTAGHFINPKKVVVKRLPKE